MTRRIVPTKVEPLTRMEDAIQPLLAHIDPLQVAGALKQVDYNPTTDLQFLCAIRDDPEQPGKVRLAARHEIRQLIMDTLSLGGAFTKETASITQGSVTAEVSRYVTAGAASVTQAVLENLRTKELKNGGPKPQREPSSPSLGSDNPENSPEDTGPGTPRGTDSEEVCGTDQRPAQSKGGSSPSFGHAGGHVRPTRDVLGGGICGVNPGEEVGGG